MWGHGKSLLQDSGETGNVVRSGDMGGNESAGAELGRGGNDV